MRTDRQFSVYSFYSDYPYISVDCGLFHWFCESRIQTEVLDSYTCLLVMALTLKFETQAMIKFERFELFSGFLALFHVPSYENMLNHDWFH